MVCVTCGKPLRSVNRSGYCQPCLRLSPEYVAKTKAWSLANPAKAKASKAKYRKKNLEKEREYSAEWKRRFPERSMAHSHKRRTRKTEAGGSFTAAEWLSLLARFNHTCPACGDDRAKLTADHIIPVFCGGPSSIDNIQPLCRSCNSRKRTQTVKYAPWPPGAIPE